MAAFASARQSISNATATKIVDAADFDRSAYVKDQASGMRVAFTSAAVSTGAALSSYPGVANLRCSSSGRRGTLGLSDHR